MQPRTAIQQYNTSVLLLSAVYAIALIGVEWLFKHYGLTGPMAYGAAALPALPILGIFAAIGRYLVQERDEYIRMLMVRQTLVASAFALSVATVWGFLESFHLTVHVDAYYVAVLWFLGLGIGASVNRILRSEAE